MLLPLIGEGWDGECPARVLCCRHSEQRSNAQRDSESHASPANASLRALQSEPPQRSEGEPVCRADTESPASL